MKRLVCFLALAAAAAVRAGTTIDPAHPYAYGGNVGWINARGDGAHGVVIGTHYCTGHLWSANCGWLSLGNGPTNGWSYSNAEADDWGVNHDGMGRLNGHAWGANIGWLTFEQTHGQPCVDLATGDLSGYVWGANVGWISLTNAQAFVRTATLDPGPDTDDDGIPDPWEYARAGGLGTLHGGGADWDGDGATDAQEAAADTDPFADTDFLRITAFAAVGGTNSLAWSSRPTRLYRVEATNALPANPGDWTDVGGGLFGPFASSPSHADVTDGGHLQRFYRVRAFLPLAP